MSETTSKPLAKLADSPIFWFVLFGLMAIAALVLVGPKFARRQALLEQNYEGRRDAWEERIRREAEEQQKSTSAENSAAPQLAP